MTVELNWHEGEDPSGMVWEHAAELPSVARRSPAISVGDQADQPPSRWKHLLLGMAIGVGIGVLILSALVVWRASQGNRLAERDVSAAAALLVEAQAAGDAQQFAALLDGTDPVWKARQVAGLRNPANPTPGQWTLEGVRLHGDLAEAEITVARQGAAPFRQLVFFRLVEGRWRFAPPAPATFGAEQQTETPHFRVHYREQDQRFVDAVTNLAEGAFVALCGELRCTDSGRLLELRLLYDGQADAPALTPGEVAVASPGLVGWQPDGQPGPAFSQQLRSQIAAQLILATAPEAPPGLLQVVGAWAATELAGEAPPADDALSSALQSGRLLPLDRAWSAVVTGDADDALAKAQMASLLRFVQSIWGSDAVGLLLQHSAGSFDKMARRAFGIDGESLQDGWLAWLTGQHTPSPGRTNS